MVRYQFGQHGEKLITVIRRELGFKVKPDYGEGKVALLDVEKGLVVVFIENPEWIHCVFERPIPLIEGVTEEKDEAGKLKWHYRGNRVDELMMLTRAAYQNL